MFLGTFVVLVFLSGDLLLKTRRELQNFKNRQDKIEKQLVEAKEEFERKEAYHMELLKGGEFLQRVARERLGYSRPDELIFRFTEEP